MIQVYNYMLEINPNLRKTAYPAHKQSELKKVYSNILKISKSSPYYKISLSKENQEYTIGVKEAAIYLREKLASISDPENSVFKSKSVSVSDEQVLSASLLSDDTEGLPDNITFRVKSMAQIQVNRGKELLEASRALIPGEYRFQITMMNETYPLTFAHPYRKENAECMRAIAEYLNKSVPGLNASVEKGTADDYSCIVIASDKTNKNGEQVFSLEDVDDFHVGIVEFFGLNRMEQPASGAFFELNGVDKQTASNVFHLENKLKITLHNISREEPVALRITPDSEKILSAVDQVLSAFNQLVRTAKNRTVDSREHYGASKLINEIKSLETMFQDELEAYGLKTDEDGMLTIVDSLAVYAARDGGIESLFTRENGFTERLMDKADAITINPIEYLDKIVVTYPNRENKTYRNPYVTSMYSGLFFSSYC